MLHRLVVFETGYVDFLQCKSMTERFVNLAAMIDNKKIAKPDEKHSAQQDDNVRILIQTQTLTLTLTSQ